VERKPNPKKKFRPEGPEFEPVLGSVSSNGISPEWITGALNNSGVAARVIGLDMSPVGTGQVCDTYRIRLTYEGNVSCQAPATVIGKFSSPDKLLVKRGFDSEFAFFRKFAPSIGMRIPRCYAAELDFETDEFVLLMEDQAPAKQGDQMRGCNAEEASVVMIEAAKFHASHWLDPELDGLSWLSGPLSGRSFRKPRHVQNSWIKFYDQYKEQLDPKSAELAEILVANTDSWAESATEGPHCLVHNDFRPDNMLFLEVGDELKMTTVDWATLGVGLGATDIAYFVGGALPIELRREVEGVLLKTYLDQLHEEGVTNYSMNDLKRDYSKYAFDCAMMAITASVLVPRTKRGDEMFLTMFHRACELALERDTVSLYVR